MDDLQKYLDTQVQIVKLDMEERLSTVLTSLILAVSILFLFTLMLLHLSVSLAQYLNNVLNSNCAGFLIMGLFFLALIVAAILSKKMIHGIIFRITNKSLDKRNKQ